MEVEVVIVDDRITVRKPYRNNRSSPKLYYLIRDMFIGHIDKDEMYEYHPGSFKHHVTDRDKLEIIVGNSHWISIRLQDEKINYLGGHSRFLSGSEVIDILNKEFDELEYGSVSQ